ncbi:MAG: hypothetical protein LOY03_05400 [Cyclobacteriaceae bacterium]|jgi:hypothetical protein|nr:hypothetical protein [Cyclobacteriaceae bacterium]
MTIAKSFLLITLVGFAGISSAQSTSGGQPAKEQSAWIVYKPINRVANKQLFESHLLHAAHRVAASPVYPTQAMTKAVHRADAQLRSGNIPSGGYPTWTISKPLHRK